MIENDSKQYLILLLVGAIAMVVILLVIVSFSWYFFQKKTFFEQQQLVEKNAEHELLLKNTIEQEEKERLRISRDLHDDIGGVLSAARMNLNYILSSINNPQKKELMHISDMLDQGIQKLRNISKQVSPPLLNEFGLAKAVFFYVSLIAENSAIEFKTNGSLKRFETMKELLLFRVIQEMLTNSMKYGAPNFIELKFMDNENFKEIEIIDNGTPFDLVNFNMDSTYSGNGIRNILNRLENCNASIHYSFLSGKNINRILIK